MTCLLLLLQELEKELKEICSRDYQVLIECLLSEREAVDAENVNAAIYVRLGRRRVVNSSLTTAALSTIKQLLAEVTRLNEASS